ncbi:MAG: PEGA domain-containing protein, partial [Candidatus Aminicenantaceae bacterium]
MRKIISIVLIISFVFLSSSCATLFKGTSEEVNFNSNPQSAEVYVNGQSMGETPVALKLKVNKTYVVEFRKEGYKSQSYTINNNVGAGWVILDVLTGLIGVIVD